MMSNSIDYPSNLGVFVASHSCLDLHKIVYLFIGKKIKLFVDELEWCWQWKWSLNKMDKKWNVWHVIVLIRLVNDVLSFHFRPYKYITWQLTWDKGWCSI